MTTSTLRAATTADAAPGAVLFKDGAFWDVVGKVGHGLQAEYKLLNDDGVERRVTQSVLRHYKFVRPAPTLDALPEVDARFDTHRRIGIFANFDAA